MCRNTCVSCLTTWDGWDLRPEPLQNKLGKWIYGCDACPYNKNAWKDEEEFPHLEEWGKGLTYAKIVLSDYSWLASVIQPQLWYIPKGKEWRYKTNALSAMQKPRLDISRQAVRKFNEKFEYAKNNYFAGQG